MATIAVFVAFGGGALAAIKLPANSVGTKNIKKGAVTAAKIANNAIDGSKVQDRSLTGSDLNLATLPKVGSASLADRATSADSAANAAEAAHATNADKATTADSATTASSIVQPEPYHEVGAPGEPPFAPGASHNTTGSPLADFQTVGFYKDREGVVHLKGMVKAGTNNLLFWLPPGYRPGDRKLLELTVSCRNCQSAVTGGPGTVAAESTYLDIWGSVPSNPSLNGELLSGGPTGAIVSLDGVTFRAGA
jgi:hypothetical protein